MQAEKRNKKLNFIIVFWKVFAISYWILELKIWCFLWKNWCDLTLTTPLKVKSMVPSYISLRTIQLLFETFFHIYHSFREILMHYLK